MGNKKTWADSPILSTNKSLYDNLSSNYIDICTEEEFLRDLRNYIKNAFSKSENISSYDITK